MATIKRPIKKAQDGVVKQKTRKTSAMKDYVNKYKGRPGLYSYNNVANDTIAGNSPANQQYSAGYGFQRAKQIEDLQKAFDKKYKGKLDIPEDKNGGKVAKKKMKNGGSLSGLKASNKRDKGIDLDGAWRKVQKKTLAGAKGKAKLTPDKQLGATKMTAKRGMKISKKK
jgi:hypothetical protein